MARYAAGAEWSGGCGVGGWMAQILPSLAALGAWTYWIIGAAAMLEGYFVTGVVMPGTLIVEAGGALVRLGRLDFLDLVWFVAIGAALGGECGYWTGRLAGRRLFRRWDPTGSGAFRRASSLFARRGGMALVIGRFLGPVSGLASLAAALAGMEPRQFRIWNLVSAVPYALAHVAIGYAAGDILSRIGPMVTRLAVLAGVLVALLGLIWLISAQIRRGLPQLLAGLAALRDMVLARPWVARRVAAHPQLAGFVARRFDSRRFDGLVLTALSLLFLYLGLIWADGVLDFLTMPQVAETDLRLARLIHAFWSPTALTGFGLVTQLGHWPVVLAVLLGAGLALAIAGRLASLVQLVVALGGELLSVWLLKGAFDRPRPHLSYFAEASASFPSGHATLAVAFWGTLAVILWREKLLGATAALVAGTTLAFLIGVSRLYLIEHFLSDVLNGWLLGGLWLVIGLAVAEWLRARGAAGPALAPARRLAAALVAVAGLAVAGGLVVVADPPRAVAQVAPPAPVIDPVVAAGSAALPLTTETLDGSPRAPISLILVAADRAAAEAALRAAGWKPVDPPDPASLARAAWADWTGAADPTAPLLPAFWQGGPQVAGFRSPDDRAEVRLWDSGLRTPDGEAVFPLALSPVGEGPGIWPVAPARDALVSAIPGRVSAVHAPADAGVAMGGQGWVWDGSLVVLRPD